MMRFLSRAKSLVVPAGAKPRRVRAGLYRDLTLEIDLQSQSQLLLGLWERETFPWIRQAATRCAWAIDIGAGSGELVAFLLRDSPATRVFAFEPGAHALAMTRRNLVLNGLDTERVILSNQFVASGGGSECVALDALAVDRTRRGFVKIDVDGAELDVLKSGEQLLREASIDALIETHSLELERDCLRHLSDRGFTCTVVPNAAWRVLIPELRPSAHCRWLWATKHDA